jgi:hypothetical protein
VPGSGEGLKLLLALPSVGSRLSTTGATLVSSPAGLCGLSCMAAEVLGAEGGGERGGLGCDPPVPSAGPSRAVLLLNKLPRLAAAASMDGGAVCGLGTRGSGVLGGFDTAETPRTSRSGAAFEGLCSVRADALAAVVDGGGAGEVGGSPVLSLTGPA